MVRKKGKNSILTFHFQNTEQTSIQKRKNKQTNKQTNMVRKKVNNSILTFQKKKSRGKEKKVRVRSLLLKKKSHGK